MDNNINISTEKENVLAGIVGAFLFSLVGGALWVVLYQFGYLAAISGLIGVICAIKGYSFFAKKESLKGIIISVVIAVVVMIVAWYLCVSLDLYNAYKELHALGEVDFTLTFVESVKSAFLFFFDGEFATAYLKDLGIGLLLCAIGSFSYISNAIKRIKKSNEAQKEQPENKTFDFENDPFKQ